MTARTAWTYQDYAALPEDGKRYEIHDGELYEMSAPTPLHQIVLVNLLDILRAHAKARALGLVLCAPLDIILSDKPTETTVLQPDIIFLERERLGLVSQRAIEGPPTLAVEVLSPSTAGIDRVRKRRLYARYGVPNFWLVDIVGRAIEANVLRAGGAYALAARASGATPIDLPPFVGLGLVPDSLWT